MKVSVKGILEGLKNTVFVKEEVEKIAAERLVVCRGCPMNSVVLAVEKNISFHRPDEHCTACGCNLHLKLRALSESCPRGKWPAVATDEEDNKIQEAIK